MLSNGSRARPGQFAEPPFFDADSFFVNLARHSDRTADEKAQNFIQILIISVTIVVVAVPEGELFPRSSPSLVS